MVKVWKGGLKNSDMAVLICLRSLISGYPSKLDNKTFEVTLVRNPDVIIRELSNIMSVHNHIKKGREIGSSYTLSRKFSMLYSLVYKSNFQNNIYSQRFKKKKKKTGL